MSYSYHPVGGVLCAVAVSMALWPVVTAAQDGQLVRPDEAQPSPTPSTVSKETVVTKGAPQDPQPDGAPPPLPDFPAETGPASRVPAPLTPEQRAWVSEKNRLIAQIERQRVTDPHATYPQLAALVEGDAKAFGPSHEETVRSLDVAAVTYYMGLHHDRAISARSLIYAAKKDLYGEQDWRTLEARWTEQQYQHLAKVPRATLDVMAQADAETPRADSEFGKGQYRQSLATAKSALTKFQQVYGADVPPMADALTLISMNHIELGDLAQAEEAAQRAVAVWRTWYSAASPQYAATLRNLGWIKHRRGNNAEAENLLRQAVEIGDNVAALRPREQADTLLKLGFVLARSGKTALGIEVLERALPAVEQTFGPDSSFYLDAELSLCDLLSVKGEYARAETIIASLQAKLSANPGLRRSLSLQVLRSGAMLQSRQGKQEAARALYQQALDSIQATPNAPPIVVADLQACIGRTYDAQQQRENAERMYIQALATYRKSPGVPTQETRSICESLVSLQGRMAIGLTLADKLDEARRKLEESVKLAGEIMGGDDPVTQRARVRLEYQAQLAAASPAARPDLVEAETQTVAGNGLYDKREYAQAFAAYAKALELSQPHLPPDSERLGNIYHGLAYCAWGQDRFDVAELWRRRAEPIFAKESEQAGRGTLQYAQTLRDIGDLCRRRSNFPEAADYLARAMEVYRPLKSAPSAEVLSTLEQLGQVYAELRDEVRCGPVLAEYLDRIRNLYGPQHVKYFQALSAQADTHRKLGQFADARQTLARARETISLGKLDPALEVAVRFLAAMVETEAGDLNKSREMNERLLADLQKPEDLTDALQVMYELLRISRRQGRLEDARQQLERALQMVPGLPEPKASLATKNLKRQLTEVLGGIAKAARQELRFADAATALRQLVELQSAAAGADDWTVREVRVALADMERMTSLNSEQLAQLKAGQQAIKDAQQQSQEQHYDAALPAALRGVDAYRAVCGEKSTLYLSALDVQIDILTRQEDFAQAEPLLRQRLALYQELVTPVTATAAEGQLNLARNSLGQGKLDECVQAAELAVETFAQAESADHPLRGAAYTLLGKTLLRLERLPAAQRAFEAAAGVLAKDRNQIPAAWTELLLAQTNLALHMQDGPRSQDLAQQALIWAAQHSGKNSLEYANQLLYLGQAYLMQNAPQQALEALKQAIETSTKLGDGESLPLAIMQHALCAAQRRVGDLPAAQMAGERAVALYEAHGKANEARKAQIDLAEVYLTRGETAPAESLLRNIVEGHRGNRPTTLVVYRRALNTLAGLAVARGDGPNALPLVEETLAEREAWLDENADILTDRLEASWRFGAREALDRLVTLAVQGATTAENAYQHALKWKGSLYARQRRLRAMRSEPQAAPLLARWGNLCGSLATLSLRAPYPEERALWNSRRTLLSADKDELERKLWGLAKSRPVVPLATVEQLQSLLPNDTALIDFLECDRAQLDHEAKIVIGRHMVAFVVRREGSVAVVDLGETGSIGGLIERWRLATLGEKEQDPDPDAAVNLAGQLRRTLWTPLAQHLDGVATVVVAPEGAIGKFPLAALPGAEPGSYLVDELAFCTIAAPGLLPELLARRTAPAVQEASLLLVGNIDYGAAPGLAGTLASAQDDKRSWLPYQFRDLPGFEPEVADIRSTFGKRFAAGQVQLLERQAATEQAFRAAAARHRYLHVATHGFFAPDVLETAASAAPQALLLGDGAETATASAAVSTEGLTSGLALAGANKINEEGQDDGILSAMEVATLDLSGVEMAVLSACETGLGESVGGESVVGLQRAFQVAGAHTTVTSLWSVSDEATRLLMARFYRNLWNKDRPMSRLEALTEAQRWMLRAARAGGASQGKNGALGPADTQLPKVFQWPTFWAAFVLGGDWQ